MKRLKIALWTLGLLSVFALLLIIFPSRLGAQGNCQTNQQVYLEHQMIPKLDSLRAAFGQNLEIEDQEYELPLLIALSHYPELKDTKIKVVYKNTSTPLYARPTAGNFLKSKKNKVFRILVDRKSTHIRGKSLNAQIGVFAHELGHIVFYKDRGLFGIASYGLNYGLSKKYQRRDEKGRDTMVVNHGLGWQIYHFAQLYTHPWDMTDHMVANNCVDKNLMTFINTQRGLITNKEFDKALLAYTNFINKSPELENLISIELYSSIRVLITYNEDLDVVSAHKFIKDMETIFSGSPFFYHLLADAYAFQNQYNEAIEALKKAAELNPGDRRSRTFIPIFTELRDNKTGL